MSATKQPGEPETAQWRSGELHLTVCVHSLTEFENGSYNMIATNAPPHPCPSSFPSTGDGTLDLAPARRAVLYSPAPNYRNSFWN